MSDIILISPDWNMFYSDEIYVFNDKKYKLIKHTFKPNKLKMEYTYVFREEM
jgi:hypothetical protein